MIEYFGLLGMIGVGLAAAGLVSRLAVRLRKSTGVSSEGAETPTSSRTPATPGSSGLATSRYFLLAIVGLALHAGAFYFYLWGASVRSAGLPGLLVMVAFGFCLMTVVFYSWARGIVAYAPESPSEGEASTLLD